MGQRLMQSSSDIVLGWITGLELLEGNIPGLLSLVHGPDVLKTDRSWDHVIVADFQDRNALAVYNTHPLHEAIKPYSLPNVQDLAYVDLELDASATPLTPSGSAALSSKR